jgi:D-aminoacyl-tRNA deacylase
MNCGPSLPAGILIRTSTQLHPMKVALVNSRQDRAGVNIRHHIEQLLEGPQTQTFRDSGRTYDFVEVKERIIHAVVADAVSESDLVIFISRHSSVNPLPILTVHGTGNYGVAELGGSNRTLAPTAPAMMQAVLRQLVRTCPEGYRVAYEVTHHGPTGLDRPSFFVEIGSTEKEWTDQAAGKAVAESVLAAAPIQAIPLIGFGGTHYAARQTDLALTTRGAFGHIAHTREIATIDPEMVRAMQEKSGAVGVYIDRKALPKPDLSRITGLLEGLGIPVYSGSEIAAMGHIPYEKYVEARRMAERTVPGARCYVHNLAGEGELVLAEINPTLLAEAARSDEAGLIRGLETLPAIHIATKDDRLVPSLVTYSVHIPQIINDLNTLCVKIIRNTEITVSERDHLIITRVRFDPHKARELGVPAGPYYKQLSSGQAVEIDGRRITPEMVSSGSEVKIHIPGLENIS